MKSAIKYYYLISPDFMSQEFGLHVGILQDGAVLGMFFVNKLAWLLVDFKMNVDKVEIVCHVVQFCSEIKLVITNRTPYSWLCNFVIVCFISDQIALHSVQFPLFIALIVKIAFSLI